jgi:hypothetical protein
MQWPHKAHDDPCQTDGPSRERLTTPIQKTSFEEKMENTYTDKGLHNWTTPSMSSLPLVTDDPQV